MLFSRLRRVFPCISILATDFNELVANNRPRFFWKRTHHSLLTWRFHGAQKSPRLFFLASTSASKVAFVCASAKWANCSSWSVATAVSVAGTAGRVVVAPPTSVVVIEGAWGAGAAETVPANKARATWVLTRIVLFWYFASRKSKEAKVMEGWGNLGQGME